VRRALPALFFEKCDILRRYEDEQKCEMNKEISMKAIEEASLQKQGFAAVKMSSLGKPELLEHVSTYDANHKGSAVSFL
jgi:hypothetical protein